MKVKTKQLPLYVSVELFTAIEAARDGQSRGGWIEQQLWKLKSIRDGAKQAGVTNPNRPVESRGGDFRSKKVD